MPVCIKCNQHKDISEFYKSTQCTSGYRGTCKICCNSKSRSQYAVKSKNKIFNSGSVSLSLPDKEYLNTILSYSDGQLYAKKSRGNVKAGSPVGNTFHDGYRRICILGAHYLVHRVIWKMHHGYDVEFLDHINNDRSDSRIENLQPILKRDNSRKQLIPANNTSGFIGVSKIKLSGKYRAMIGINSRDVVIGTFSDPVSAAIAYNKAARMYHGESGDFKARLNESKM